MAVDKHKHKFHSLAAVKDAGDDFDVDEDGTSNIEPDVFDDLDGVQSLHEDRPLDKFIRTKSDDHDKHEFEKFKDQLVKDAVGAIGRATAQSNMDHGAN
jgi:hypothetical protein